MAELGKLHYFNLRGKGELIRLTFAAAGADYEDIRYKPPFPGMGIDEGLDWDADAKAGAPMGQMPFLEIEGQVFCQQSAIARFVAKKHGLMGNDDMQAFKVDMVVETMWPDVAMKCIAFFFEKDEDRKAKMKEEVGQKLPGLLEKIGNWVEGDFILGSTLSLADLAIFDVVGIVRYFYPDFEMPAAIEKVVKNVSENPNVKKWLETRPVTNF